MWGHGAQQDSKIPCVKYSLDWKSKPFLCLLNEHDSPADLRSVPGHMENISEVTLAVDPDLPWSRLLSYTLTTLLLLKVQFLEHIRGQRTVPVTCTRCPAYCYLQVLPMSSDFGILNVLFFFFFYSLQFKVKCLFTTTKCHLFDIFKDYFSE